MYGGGGGAIFGGGGGAIFGGAIFGGGGAAHFGGGGAKGFGGGWSIFTLRSLSGDSATPFHFFIPLPENKGETLFM